MILESRKLKLSDVKVVALKKLLNSLRKTYSHNYILYTSRKYLWRRLNENFRVAFPLQF